ncbi:efflux RND transporter permease subunit, partial [Patescibacteria group bacterium]|nr:efflux RND transporter permease subunit [Patescibacteria group bacterium]
NVFRSSNVNIDKANKDAQYLVSKSLKASGDKYKIYTALNTSDLIDDQFNELGKDLSITIGLVSLLLLLFLGVRQALVALFATPMTFLITFIVMHITGIALSFIATFSLLLSLGLLVDDTIVVISAMTAYYRSGKFTPLQTALLVWKDFLIAILTTTITTVFAFVPLLLASGIIGEFIKPIPIVVSATLLGSFFVAMFLIMPFIIFLLKPSIPYRVKVLIRILMFILIIGLFVFILPKNQILFLEILLFAILMYVSYKIRNNIADKTIKRLIRFKKYKKYLSSGLISFNFLEAYYTKAMVRILNSASARKKIIIMVAIFSLFSYLLVPFGFVKSEFFPKTEEDFIYVSGELPSGTNLIKAKEESLKVFNFLKNTPGIKFITLQQNTGFNSMSGIAGTSSNNFLYTLILVDKKERKISSIEIADYLRKNTKTYTAGKLSVVELSSGPPAGADLQINLYGPDFAVLDTYATKIEDYLKKQQGITNVDRSVKSGTSKLVFIPDEQKISQAGVSKDIVGFWLRLFASGFKASSIKLDPELEKGEDITIRLSTSTQNVEDINSINIPNSSGGNIPLTSLGTFKLSTNPTVITRLDGKRVQTVSAGVARGYNISQKNQQLENFAKDLNLPADYSWGTGGVNEENAKSVQSILIAMILSFILILSTMVLQFNSFRRALIVLAVIPLSISGVFIIFGLTQTPLSFPALIGILALFGIVVKNSILVVDKILINIDSGLSFKESIIDGASSRLEPIALTSLAAILGLLPITLSNALWRGLGGAIIAGLTFSGTIMLFFIPVVYYMIYNPKRSLNKKK